MFEETKNVNESANWGFDLTIDVVFLLNSVNPLLLICWLAEGESLFILKIIITLNIYEYVLRDVIKN